MNFQKPKPNNYRKGIISNLHTRLYVLYKRQPECKGVCKGPRSEIQHTNQ